MRAAAALLLVALSAAAPPAAAAETGRAAAELQAAAARLAAAGSDEARLAALSAATAAAEEGLAAMREGLRRSAVRAAQLAAQAEAARGESQTALGRLAALGRAPLASQAAQPAGPLSAARGAWLAAALGPDRAAQAARLERRRAELETAAEAQRDAWRRMRLSLVALKTARAALAEALREGRPAPASRPDAAPALAALEAFAAASARAGESAPAPPTPRPAAPGTLPPPAPGPVVTAFGTTDAIGQRITGVEIAAPAWTAVRSPRASTVRYAGPVAGRGEAVILEPQPGALLTFAGLARTTVSTGDVVLAGAAVGHLGVISPESAEFLVEAPVAEGALSGGLLYVEVREDGKPIDPSAWFALPEGRAAKP